MRPFQVKARRSRKYNMPRELWDVLHLGLDEPLEI